MDCCPHCQRKLLSHASVNCNWCSQPIEDPTYLQEAEAAREAFFAEQQQHDAMSLARIRDLNINAFDPSLTPVTNSVIFNRSFNQRMLRNTNSRQRNPVSPPQGQDAPKVETALHNETSPSNEPPHEESSVAERFNHLELG